MFFSTRDAALAALALALGCFTIACTGAPVPLVARAGTTFGIALTGEDADWNSYGYGTADHPDPQRGALEFRLEQGATSHPLTTRLISRVAADPASRAGLDGEVELLFGVYQRYLHQVLALIDIPEGTPAGSYNITARHLEETGGAEIVDPALLTDHGLWTIEILPSLDADWTPLDAALGATDVSLTDDQIRSAIPYPKLVLDLPVTSPEPAAGTIVLTYPDSEITIEGALVNDMVGQKGLITFEVTTPGTLVLHYMTPADSPSELAVVFSPKFSTFSDRVATTDFGVASATFWDASGAALPAGTLPAIEEIR